MNVAASLQPTFVYHFREFIPGNDITLGGRCRSRSCSIHNVDSEAHLSSPPVAHASELPLIFGPVPAVAAVEDDFAVTWRDFYINFVNDLHPGRKSRLYSM